MRYIVVLTLMFPLMLGCTKKIEPSSTYPVAEEGKVNDAMKTSLGEKSETEVKADSDSSEIMKLLIEGSNAHNAGRYPAAIDVFKKIIELDSNHIDAWMRMGSSFRGADERQEAIRCFRKAVELDPENGLGLYDLGAIFMEEAQMDSAVKYFELATKVPNGKIDERYLGLSYLLMGNIHLNKKRYESAVFAYEQAQKYEVSRPDAQKRLLVAIENAKRDNQGKK